MGLYDGILVKDNHLAPLGSGPDAITRAMANIRSQVGDAISIEIEVETLEQFERARNGKPGIILLDNMNLDMMREAVRRRNALAPSVQLEASGGVTLDTVRRHRRDGRRSHQRRRTDSLRPGSRHCLGLCEIMTPDDEWHLDTRHIGRRVLVYNRLDSTNTLAASLAHDETLDGLVVLCANSRRAAGNTAGTGPARPTWAS